eukprot:2762554-Pyramimonas_sp.AAC.1
MAYDEGSTVGSTGAPREGQLRGGQAGEHVQPVPPLPHGRPAWRRGLEAAPAGGAGMPGQLPPGGGAESLA